MKYAKITVNDVDYVFYQTEQGNWITNNTTVSLEDAVVVTLTNNNQQIQVSVNDPELEDAIMLLAVEGTTFSGKRMYNYYPQVIQRILEFQALMLAEGFEVDFLNSGIDIIINDSYLLTMGEERIAQWEQALGLKYDVTDSIGDRRDAVIARIRSQGKLNTTSINAIVNAFTGGTAISYVENSTLYVKITPPPNNKLFKFENVERELMKKKPAHLGLNVSRNYATWGEVKDNLVSWENIKDSFSTWEELSLWVVHK